MKLFTEQESLCTGTTLPVSLWTILRSWISREPKLTAVSSTKLHLFQTALSISDIDEPICTSTSSPLPAGSLTSDSTLNPASSMVAHVMAVE